MMSRKHYVEAARIIREHGGENRDALTREFADMFKANNSRFDQYRFRAACEAEPMPDHTVIIVHGYEALNNSVNGNPRYKLFADSGTYITSSDVADAWNVPNGWTVDHVTKDRRPALVTFTKAGRIATLKWADGDN